MVNLIAIAGNEIQKLAIYKDGKELPLEKKIRYRNEKKATEGKNRKLYV